MMISSRSNRQIQRVPLLLSRFYCAQHQHQPSSNNAGSTSTETLSIATKQRLYMIDPHSPGSVFFLPHGAKIFNRLVSFMKLQQEKQEFKEVITPLIFKKDLWKVSGHWENYKEDMFKVEGNENRDEEHEPGHTEENDETVYGLKPMNCPGHCLIFNRFKRSYNELPIRLSDWSSLHRNESSGALTGLTRVRRFHQDDGHIFCTSDQVSDEISKTLQLIKLVYSVFQFNEYRMVLSTRPETSYIGSLEDWNRAESQLTEVLDQINGRGNWLLREGDGAFYGPKIDILLTDTFGKEHQVGTIQLDFQLPRRFELEYIDQNSNVQAPIMIHRAIFGSVERFMALLIDHYQGKWPFWLSSRQAIVLPISDKHVAYAETVKEKLSGGLVDTFDFSKITQLTGYKFSVDIDSRSQTVGMRIKEAIQLGYNYIILVGDKEMESGEISIRSNQSRKIETVTLEQTIDMFKELENNYK